ncbi:MAG: 3-oxoacyl-[acyl-carrier-protein] reductase [Verrucomicrobiota bacterium]
MLYEQVAVVTGASRGIGRAIAVRLAKEKCKIAGVSRSEKSAQETGQFVEEAGGVYKGYAVDVSDEAAVAKTVEKIMEDFGRIDILINNAGITRDNLLLRMTGKDWDDVMQTNLKGAFNWTKPVSRIMMKAQYGRIVNISSIIGLRGNAGQANYAAAKAGLIGFSKSVAREFASRNMTCNVICPGFIQTDMTASLPEDLKTRLLNEIPLKRLGKPEDIAGAVAFLCSKEANYLTGQVLTIDGGLVM